MAILFLSWQKIVLFLKFSLTITFDQTINGTARFSNALISFEFWFLCGFFSKMWKYWNHNFFVNLEYAWLPWCNDFWALLREEAFRSRYYYEIVVKSHTKLWLKLAKTPINIWLKTLFKCKKGHEFFFSGDFMKE